jgi:replication fork protection complex subunit Tof1/Swi1
LRTQRTLLNILQLLTVQQMAESLNEDDQDIAENIQNRIFYEEATHDRVLGILRNYKDQGFGYLDSCTELAHVFVRMLERYSKQNSDLTIRSKRRRKKRKEQEANKGDEDSGAELERQAAMVSKERKFDFTRFSARFMTQGCVDTFVSFTRYYRDLSQEQLKRCHRFFYREAFKVDLSTILFRVDVMQLFYNMIKGQESMDRELPCFKEWEELVRQLFRRLTKRLKERPELMVEMLFSKIPSTLFYLEHGYLQEVTKSAPRPPAELEITPDLSPLEGIGVVTSLLILETKFELVSWVGDVLEKAIEERTAWESADEAKKAATSSTPIEINSPGSPKAADSEEGSHSTARNQEDTHKAPIICESAKHLVSKDQLLTPE